jgi:hypothetical protein
LAQLKDKGVKLGNPCLEKGEQIPGSGDTTNARAARIKTTGEYALKMAPFIEEMKAQGHTSLRQIAAALNAEGYKTVTGKEWQAMAVSQVIKRAALLSK